MRFKKAWFAALSVAMVLAAIGCGGGNGDSGSGADGEAGGGDGDFEVAMILPGSVNDQGYNADAKRTAGLIEDETGGTVEVSESVAVANQADVFRQYASQGYDLVVGWGGQFSDGATLASEEFPDVNFLVANSNVENGSNLASMETTIEQWQFFAGFLVAKLSDTGSVGWIGGECFPATAANLHGTKAGARYADPKVDFEFRFTGDFEDPTKAQSAAEAMIDQGVGAITGNLNNGWPGVYKAAEESQIPLVTEWVDNHEQAPSVIASSVLKSQAKFLAQLATEAQEGKFKGDHRQFSLPEDWGPIVSDTELLPDDVYDEALAVQEKVASGEIKVPHNENCPS